MLGAWDRWCVWGDNAESVRGMIGASERIADKFEKKRYQSMSQKVWIDHRKYGRLISKYWQIVQARMWSQGITIGVVIAAAAVTRSRTYRREAGDVGRLVTNGDHSWQEKVAVNTD